MTVLFMEYGIFDFIYLIGSLGLFLYGMKIMSEGLQKVAGDRMRSVLSAMTSNRFFGILTGFLITTLIQSSSATTLMVVSFVNAGLLTLAQSISVIMGANIGTTVTAWIISLLGFKVSVSAFAVPVIALTIPLIFSKKPRWNSWGSFVMGFSLLFLGLQFLKDSMPDLQANPDALSFLQKYTDMGFGSVLIFLLIGTVLTFVVQSSSATVAITLIMCSKGWIPFEMGTAMILGENIGTTITANLAALNANINAKRTAFSHFLFNAFGVAWVLCLYYPIVRLVTMLVTSMEGADPSQLFPQIHDLALRYEPGDIALMTDGNQKIFDPEMAGIQSSLLAMAAACSTGLALFHTLFNITNTVVMVWFVPLYVRICTAVITPNKKAADEKEHSHLQYISMRMLSTSELSMLQVQQEAASYLRKVNEMLKMTLTLLQTKDQEEFERTFNRMEKYENICDRVEVEIVQYLSAVSEGDLSSDSRRDVRVMMRIATEIESMGDACFNMARILKRKNKNGITFSPMLEEQLRKVQEIAQEVSQHTIRVLESPTKNENMLFETNNLENKLNNKRDALLNKNLKDLEDKKYEYQESVHYLDLIDEYEHFGDYAVNVVEAFVVYKL